MTGVAARQACHDEGMSVLFAIPVAAVVGFAVLLFLTLTRPSSPLCVRRAGLAGPPPEPEPRVPRDTSRPYPRPKGHGSKLNRVCPVCGTGRETGDLDGRVFGWPAHRTCAEWLGDWKPQRRFPVPPAAGIAEAKVAITVNASPGAQINVGNGNSQRAAFTSQQVEISARLANGLISLNEAREHLDREIVASWGVPPLMLQEHTHKVGDPVPAERCPKCGAQFAGPPAYLRQAYEMHRQVGCVSPRRRLPDR